MSIWPTKSLWHILLFAGLLAWAQVGAAFISAPPGGGINVTEELAYIEDAAGTRTFEEVSADTNWLRPSGKNFTKGYNDSAWWLKFGVVNPNKTGDWLLEIAYPLIDYLTVYIVDEAGRERHFDLGDKLPFSHRPIEHRTFLVPLDLEPNQPVTIYLRVVSTSSIQVPLVLWESAKFSKAQSTESLIHGFIFGSLIIMAIYNLLVYTVLRDRSYTYYVSYIFFLVLFVSGLYGWSYKYLWPNATRWNDQSILFFLAGLVLFAALFCWSFLDVKTFKQKWVVLLFKFHFVTLPPLMVASIFLPYGTLVRVLVPYGAISCGMALGAGVIAWRERRPFAPIYTIAWTFLFAGGFVLALSKIGIIGQTLLTTYALQFGSVLETVLLSFALAQRINSEKSLRLDAQNELLDMQVQTNVALEERVAERTRELEGVNKKLKDLSDTDQLSGLKNRRFFDNFLTRELARSCRKDYSIGILLVDIDHFKSINDTYGHTVGDTCIQAISQALLKSVNRPADVVVRYGGEEFCIVLPQTDAVGTLHVANRSMVAVRDIKFPAEDLLISITCSIGCYTEIPTHPNQSKEFIDRADSALYDAKKTGRDKIVVYQNDG